mmetsp:Transcript_46460/g.145483  ORF Transcript_46460/g.145483 Transcript_46460/m.145483 type:complete len:322 (+) Transcript_46460:301-1266(+)
MVHARNGRQATLWPSHQELPHQVHSLHVEVPQVGDLQVKDLPVDVVGALVEKRRVAGQHLVDDHAQGPHVGRRAMATGLDDLGGQVLGSSDDREALVAAEDLGKPKVHEFHMARPVNHDVLGLQVPVNNVHKVQVFQGEQHLRRVELAVVWGQPAFATQTTVQLAAVHVLHEKEDPPVVLEAAQELYDKGAGQHLEDRLLSLDVSDLAQVHDELLLHGLERHRRRGLPVFRVLQEDHADIGEGAASDDLAQLELLDVQLGVHKQHLQLHRPRHLPCLREDPRLVCGDPELAAFQNRAPQRNDLVVRSVSPPEEAAQPPARQ